MDAQDEGIQRRVGREPKPGERMGICIVLGLLFGTLWGNIAFGLSLGIIVGSILEGFRRRSRQTNSESR